MWIIIQKKFPFWYFDATGSILKKIDRQNLPYLYSIVTHDYESKSIIPIAEFFTTSHTQINISIFLMQIKNFFLKYSSLCGKKYGFLYPFAPVIVTDFSWPLINSVLDVFNHMSMMQYLEVAFEIIINRKKEMLFQIHTIIHLCSIHYLKSFIRNSKKIIHKDKNNEVLVKKTLIFCFTLLQNSTSIDEIEFLLQHIYNMFNISKKNQTFLHSICLIENRIKNRNLDQDFSYEDSKSDMDRLSSRFELNSKQNLIITKKQLKGLKNISPFKKYFDSFINTKLVNVNEMLDKNLEDNVFFNPMLFKLIRDLLYLLPLWTGVLLNLFTENADISIDPINRLDNNPAEGWFQILKNKIVVNSGVMPSEIASLNYERLRFKFKTHYASRLSEISPRFTLLDLNRTKEIKENFWQEAKKNKNLKGKDFFSNEVLETWKPKKKKKTNPNFYGNQIVFNDQKTEFKLNKNTDFDSIFRGKSNI
jgi:hypothetical protein